MLARAADAEQKLTGSTGPGFRDDDPIHRGVKIPREYWKVAVLVDANGNLALLAFVLSQEDLLAEVAFAPIDVVRTFQSTVAGVELLTGLNLGRLCLADIGTVARPRCSSNCRIGKSHRVAGQLRLLRGNRHRLAAEEIE